MVATFIRTEKHALTTSAVEQAAVVATLASYREFVRLLAGIIWVHHREISVAASPVLGVEALFHPTRDRPTPRYALLDRRFHKFPSYLRRAAINAAYGAVCSFQSNYARWVTGRRSQRNAQPPSLGRYLAVNPPLYGGQCIRWAADYQQVEIKLRYAQGWAWSQPMAVKGRPKRLDTTGAEVLSPTLVLHGTGVALHCPVKVAKPKPVLNDIVCAVDVGINTAATCAIVDSVGTVRARTFLKCGRHNDQRDKLMAQIRSHAKATCGKGGKLGPGFCRALYQRISGLNRDAAVQLGRQIMVFAQAHGATHLVFENLQGWRPKGGRPEMRVRFHRFLHRMLVQRVQWWAEQAGLKLALVWPRGTSAWAYDGSGKVIRSRKNYSLCRLPSGRWYNADLNAASNIAARYLARALGIAPRNRAAVSTGKSSGLTTRMPWVLADLWRHAGAPV